MHLFHSEIVAEARALRDRFASVADVDEQLARLAYDQIGDPQLAVSWLALPLEELGERSPVEAWAEGERASVMAALARMR